MKFKKKIEDKYTLHMKSGNVIFSTHNPNARYVVVCPECEFENEIEECDDQDEMYCDECSHVLDPDDAQDIKKYRWRQKH